MMIGNKPLNIVVFGCDNTGKTTLCEDLEKWLTETHKKKVNMVHSLGPNKTIDEQIEFMKLCLNNEVSEVNVFDRFPVFEETVCGTVLRNKDYLGIHISGLLIYLFIVTLDYKR